MKKIDVEIPDDKLPLIKRIFDDIIIIKLIPEKQNKIQQEHYAELWFNNLSKDVQNYFKLKYCNGCNPPDNYDILEIYIKENNLSENFLCL